MKKTKIATICMLLSGLLLAFDIIFHVDNRISIIALFMVGISIGYGVHALIKEDEAIEKTQHVCSTCTQVDIQIARTYDPAWDNDFSSSDAEI